jgi:hypothetical protein
MKFTAIIVSGGTSDAECIFEGRLVRLAISDPATTQPSIGKLRLYIVPVKRLIQSIVP